MTRFSLVLCLTVLSSTLAFAETDPPSATPDCTAGKLNQVRLTTSTMDVEPPDAAPDPTVQVTSIADSIEPLKKRFNAHKGKPRFVAILSPT